VNKNRLELLIATKNQGKVTELKKLLGDLPIALKSLRDFPSVADAEESGATFAENAALKASFYARETGLRAVADDSGLEVAALGGAPGVFSARYAGANATDEANVEKLLREMGEVDELRRAARFVCVMALADDAGAIKFSAEGLCDGAIVGERRGANGFGYDPIFAPAGFDATFAEIPDAVKHQISHRARAAAKIIQYLRDFYAI
jgi:XTP/dITP diphosphohydrolase